MFKKIKAFQNKAGKVTGKISGFARNVVRAARFAHTLEKFRRNKVKAALALGLASLLALSSQSFAVSINAASQEILESVKGVGPSKAKSIITEREKNGAYKDADDLSRRVRGIGAKTVSKMQDAGLSFDGEINPKSSKETRARRTPKRTAVSVGDDEASMKKSAKKEKLKQGS
jgi:competence ComEA-like helix-hairpin-helix protein